MFFDVAQAPGLYARLQQSVVSQLLSLGPDDGQVPVAACPGWTVKDVMAHVSGLVAETLANVPLPRGNPEGTARQVADRSDLSLAEVCDEWLSNAGAFADYGIEDPAYVAALTSDLVVHSLDIGEAVGGGIEADSEAVQFVAARYGHGLVERAASAGYAITLVLDGSTIGNAEPTSDELVLQTSSLDFLRAVTARRSRTQVRAMDWTGNPDALLDTAWAQYGPLTD